MFGRRLPKKSFRRLGVVHVVDHRQDLAACGGNAIDFNLSEMLGPEMIDVSGERLQWTLMTQAKLNASPNCRI